MRTRWLALVCFVASCERGERAKPVASVDETSTPSTRAAVSPVLSIDPRPLADAMPEAVGTGDAIGVAGPATQIVVAANGRWTLLCQAHADTDGDGRIAVEFGHHGDPIGDELVRHLIVGAGEGQAIDQVLAVSDDETRLVVVRGGRLELVDVSAATVTELPLPAGAAGEASADFAGDRLVYARGGTLVVRKPDGTTTAFDLGAAVIGGIDAGRGRWTRVVAATRDDDGDGAITLPKALGTMSDHPCAGPWLSMSVYGHRGDRNRPLWIDTEQAAIVDDADAIWPLPTGWLRRSADGALVLGRDVIAGKDCDPVVLGVAEAPWRITYVCAHDGERSKIRVVGEALPVREGITIDTPAREQMTVQRLDEQVICVLADAGVDCLDLTAGTFTSVTGDVLWQHDRHLLLRDGDALVVQELGSPAVAQVARTRGEARAGSGGVCVVGDAVIDLAAARRLGTAPGGPIAAVARDGRLLVAAGGEPYGAPEGPFRWIRP